jgi:hypothetical protein
MAADPQPNVGETIELFDDSASKILFSASVSRAARTSPEFVPGANEPVTVVVRVTGIEKVTVCVLDSWSVTIASTTAWSDGPPFGEPSPVGSPTSSGTQPPIDER